MNNRSLYVIVSITGASVLALEILGTRVLGPFYGVSLYLWSALISVTLIALSAGYAIGGRLADRSATGRTLGAVLAAAGIWTLLVIFLKHPVLELFSKAGLRIAVLGAAFILFAPPLTLLGMISPFAIRMRARRIEEVGRSAGYLSALSTIASVVSALAVGFFLIPEIGVNRLLVIIGGILIITGSWFFLAGKKLQRGITSSTLLLLLLLMVRTALISEQPDPSRGLLAVCQSPYGELRVADTDEGRHLLIDGGIHSLVDTATWNSFFHYAAVMDLPKYFFTKPGRMLLLGLGGGSLAKQYAREGWQVDALEIDPGVIRLARQYFSLQPSDATIIETDGREFLLHPGAAYDVILLDVFGSSSLPFHLVTLEAFALVRKRLAPEGIVAINLETLGWHDPLVGMISLTLAREFREVLALPMEEPPDRSGNVVLLAANRMLVLLRDPERNEALEPEWRYGPGYQKVHAWDNRFTPDTLGAVVLTDDLNPVDLRSEAINLAVRKDLHRYFSGSGVSY